MVIFSTVHRAADDRIFHKEARSLARAGYNVVVFAAAPHDGVLDGVRIRALSLPSSRFRRAFASPKLVGAILKEKAEVHHFHDPELLPAGLLLRLLGKKAIYDAHEDLPKDVLSKPYLRRWLRPVLSGVIDPVERWSARRMSGVLAATDSIGKRFRRATVIHNYPVLAQVVRSQTTPPCNTGPGPFVVFFGTITRIAGAREMLAAVNAVSNRFPVRLKLLGVFEDRALRSEGLRSGLGGRVEYQGFVPMPEVYQHYRGALAALVLLHPVPKFLESMPIKMFESMACGVPIIASDFPLWRRIVHDQGCGLVVDPLNVPQVADAIIYLIEHPEEAKKMGRRGRELVEKKYNWESESKKLLLLYEELLGKAGLGVRNRMEDTSRKAAKAQRTTRKR